jgi:hypothetical protein
MTAHLITNTIPDIGGAVTFWGLDALLDLSKLEAGLANVGFKELAPAPRTRLAVLKDAIGHYAKTSKKQSTLVNLDDKSGFAVVEGDGQATPGSTWGRVSFVMKMAHPTVGVNVIEMDPFIAESYHPIKEYYDEHINMITAAQAGKSLVDICKALAGACLRLNGGIYWIKDEFLPIWNEVAEAFRQAGPATKIYLIRHRLDFDSVQAVYDGILNEMQTELTRIRAEIMSGELKDSSMELREHRCGELAAKMTKYESWLGVSFGKTKEIAEGMTDAQAFASLFKSMEAVA